MSARAASRLEHLGFRRVFRYTAGKADWVAFGLPVVGKATEVPWAGTVARRDVARCHLREPLSTVRRRLAGSASATAPVCIVVDDDGVVQGVVRPRDLRGRADAPVEEVMEPGPVTIRPSVSLRNITERMRRKNVETVLVTTPDGHLWGLLHLEDAERTLREVARTGRHRGRRAAARR